MKEGLFRWRRMRRTTVNIWNVLWQHRVRLWEPNVQTLQFQTHPRPTCVSVCVKLQSIWFVTTPKQRFCQTIWLDFVLSTQVHMSTCDMKTCIGSQSQHEFPPPRSLMWIHIYPPLLMNESPVREQGVVIVSLHPTHVCECEGWVCVCAGVGTSSLRLIHRKTVTSCWDWYVRQWPWRLFVLGSVFRVFSRFLVFFYSIRRKKDENQCGEKCHV